MTQITYQEMVRKLGKDGKNILESLTPEKVHIWHMASCIMGEVGELIEGYDQKGMRNENFAEELGDIEFYLEGARDGLSITLDQVETCTIHEFNPMTYPIDGLVVESGNIFDAVKKWFIYEQEVDFGKLLGAMKRFEFYMRIVRQHANLTREQVLEANMAKLAKRYGPDYSYSNAAARSRPDKNPLHPQRRVIGGEPVIGGVLDEVSGHVLPEKWKSR